MHEKKVIKLWSLPGKIKENRRDLSGFPQKDRVLVEGVNIVKKHTKPNQENPQGGIISLEAAIHISNVMQNS